MVCRWHWAPRSTLVGERAATVIGHRSYASKNPPPHHRRLSGRSLALPALLALHRLPEAEAFAIHLEDVAAVRQPVQQRRRHALALEHLAPVAERQVARHQQALALVA